MSRKLFPLLLAMTVLCVSAGPLAPNTLRCEHLESPAFIDSTVPSFSWALRHSDRAQAQTAYRIIVATDPSFAPQTVVWDSLKTVSVLSQHIPYAGARLLNDTRYYWEVSWFDSAGTQSAYSEPAEFHTAILDAAFWTPSVWIGAASGTDLSVNMFRYEFDLPAGDVISAVAYISGMGLYELHANGANVDPKLKLTPGWTQYERLVFYVAHDLTASLHAGATNALGVMLGVGWRDATKFPNKDHDTPASDDHEQALRLVMHVRYRDSRPDVVITTSAHWDCSKGPVTSSSIYDGTSYDARLEQPGWDATGFKPAPAWASAVAINGPPGRLELQMIQPIREQVRLSIVSVTEPESGVIVLDMGQNFAGVCTLRIPASCPSGTTIQLRHGEALQSSGMIYTANLRAAKATDHYTCNGKEGSDFWFTPTFTYHGFRYVEVTGYPGGKPSTTDWLVGIHFHSAVAQRGELQFGSPSDPAHMLQQIESIVRWGQRSNLMSVPTDCPQRDERLGWMGDACLSADSMSMNFDAAALFNNFVELIVAEEDAAGTIPDVVPFMKGGGRPADPSWSAAFPQLVWVGLRQRSELHRASTSLRQLLTYIDYVTIRARQSGLKNLYASYGDWCPPPPAKACPKSFLAAFSYVRSVQQVAELARATGDHSEYQRMRALAFEMAGKFREAFYVNATKLYTTGNLGPQTTSFAALRLGSPAVDPTDRNAVVDVLLNDIVAAHNVHITTGISGFKLMWEVLPLLGREDLALKMAMVTDYPSIGYMMYNTREPATTVWELLDAPSEGPGMNSRNHHMFSSIGQALYQTFAGVQLPAEQPLSLVSSSHFRESVSHNETGYERVVFRPPPVLGLGQAAAILHTGRGDVKQHWTRSGGMQCNKAAEHQSIVIDCGSNGNGPLYIDAIEFASFGTPLGECGTFGYSSCHAANSTEVVESLCLGKSKCVIPALDTVYGDPCYDTYKWMAVQARCGAESNFHASVSVPTGSTAELQLPLITLGGVNVWESGSIVWDGTFHSGVPGVKAAEYVWREGGAGGAVIQVEVSSGDFEFQMDGKEGVHVCASTTKEDEAWSVKCPVGVISYVAFSSYGTPPAQCPSSSSTSASAEAPLTIGGCHAGTSKPVVERACVGHAACTIIAGNDVFGDPCYGTTKHFVAEVVCVPEPPSVRFA